MKAATYSNQIASLQGIFQSTPPVKAATKLRKAKNIEFDISIHAAREGGDRKPAKHIHPDGISIHAAREGGDAWTCSCLRAVPISIHAAREGGDDVRGTVFIGADISIHAAREGGDDCASPHSKLLADFNPRRP